MMNIMNFTEKIEILKNKLTQSSLTGHELALEAEKIVQQLDWRDFKREQVLSFLNEPIPDQHYTPYNFGRFNLTLVKTPRFSIQVYFMDDVATEIHTHAFHGYFHYLEGRVHQAHFERLEGKQITPLLKCDGIKLLREEILYPGQGCLVIPGPIHQVLRLDTQSTVLMVMTHPFLKQKSELILPTGHIISQEHISDRFYRLVTLLQTAPDLENNILPLLSIEETLMYCFRDGAFNSLRSDKLNEILIKHLSKSVDIAAIQESFKRLELKKQKLRSIGSES